MIEAYAREFPDWPQPGILFRDLSPLYADPVAFAAVVEELARAVRELGGADRVIGVESRGFLVGAPVALALGVPFTAVRKQGKLPGPTHTRAYALEYGEAVLEVQADAIGAGERVVAVDDVLATGGTLTAAAGLVADSGAAVVAHLVLVELQDLGGRAALAPTPTVSLASY